MTAIFYLLAAGLFVIAAGLLTRPLWWARWFKRRSASTEEIEALGRQLRQLQDLQRAGALGDEALAQGRRLIEQKLLEVVRSGSSRTPAAAAGRPGPRLAFGLVAFVGVVAAVGYSWLGSPDRIGIGPGAAVLKGPAEGAEAAAAPHALDSAQVSAMIDRLAERLKSQPDDADGWQMLGRSYVAIGKFAEAGGAFREAARLRPSDAALLADYADALAMTNGRRLDGEPSALIDRALKADPSNAKALALAGTAAFDRGDYKGAIAHWEKIVQLDSADAQLVRQAKGALAEARQLAGLPAEPAPAPVPGAPAASARVSGIVTLAPGLKDQVAPDETLFVFARAVDGPRMPLSILRKRVKDLPLQFTLDDSLAMSPDAKLSSVSQVIVGARISKSGNAMPQPGDLQGQAPPARVGANDLKIEISERVVR